MVKGIGKHILIVFLIGVFISCATKEVVPASPEEQLFLKLSGTLLPKKWSIDVLYINGIEKKLSETEKSYSKTYKKIKEQIITASFIDSDGQTGTASLKSLDAIEEKIENIQSGAVIKKYKINLLTDTVLDVTYIFGNINIREVYRAN